MNAASPETAIPETAIPAWLATQRDAMTDLLRAARVLEHAVPIPLAGTTG